jgi:hypothetical protein
MANQPPHTPQAPPHSPPHNPAASTQPPAAPPKPPSPAAAPSKSDSTHQVAKDGQNLAIKHAHEARIKELELELETEKKRIAAIEEFSGKEMSGELGHGEKGWVRLDEEGKPTGPATIDPPEVGVVAAPVVGYFPEQADHLVTPSGAPITPNMQPLPDPRNDPGMEARIKESLASAGQPVDAHGDLKRRQDAGVHIQPNSPVINTPPRA